MFQLRRPAVGAAIAVLLGLVIGALVGVTASARYRAVVTMSTEVRGSVVPPSAGSAAGPLVPTLLAVARGSLVVENLSRSTGVSQAETSDRLRVAQVPGTALIRIGYDGRSTLEARRTAQEAGTIFASIVAARFGAGARPVSVAVVEPAHADGGARRPIGRDALAGALVGLVGSVAVWLLARRRRLALRPAVARAPAAPAARDPRGSADRERMIKDRVLAFAPARAPVDPQPATPAQPSGPALPTGDAGAYEALMPRPTPPPPRPAPPAMPEAAGLLAPGNWDLRELERRARAAGGRELDERLAYLSAFSTHTENGVLGHAFDQIVYDVFGDVVP
jgi:hypothetical protein